MVERSGSSGSIIAEADMSISVRCIWPKLSRDALASISVCTRGSPDEDAGR